MAGQLDMGAILGEQLLNAAKIMEEQVEQEIKDLENLDEDDLEAIRRRKLGNLTFLFDFRSIHLVIFADMMKKMQEKKVEWKSAGHGEYSEIPEEKEFFTVTKGSDNCVIHFYRDETFRCKIFDKHFSLLAKKHLETRFCKINAEKCPFLCDRLKIKFIPTVLCIKNQQTTGQIVGFGDLGNTDEFSTEMLEWRLAHVSSVVDCEDNSESLQSPRLDRTNILCDIHVAIFFRRRLSITAVIYKLLRTRQKERRKQTLLERK